MPSSLGLAMQPQAVESAQHQHEALGGPAVHWDQRVIDQVSMKQRLHSKIHTSHPRGKDRLKTCHYKRQQHHRSCRWRVKWGRHRGGKKGNQPLVSLGGQTLPSSQAIAVVLPNFHPNIFMFSCQKWPLLFCPSLGIQALPLPSKLPWSLLPNVPVPPFGILHAPIQTASACFRTAVIAPHWWCVRWLKGRLTRPEITLSHRMGNSLPSCFSFSASG